MLSVLIGCHTATGTVTPGPKSSERARYATSDNSAEGGAANEAAFAAGCEAENAIAGFVLPTKANDDNAAEARKFLRGIVLAVLRLLSDKCNDVRVLRAGAESARYACVSPQMKEANNIIKANEQRRRVGW